MNYIFRDLKFIGTSLKAIRVLYFLRIILTVATIAFSVIESAKVLKQLKA